MFDERGIHLTPRERDILRLLGVSLDQTWAAQQLGVSKSFISATMLRLRKKAQLI
jgi:DNA-binding CsgD family transcriptional regulator